MHESIWFLGTDPCCSDLKTSVNPVLIKHVYTLTKWCHIHDTVNNTVLKMWAAKQWHFFGPPCSKTARLAKNLWCHNKIRLGTHFDCVYHACVIFYKVIVCMYYKMHAILQLFKLWSFVLRKKPRDIFINQYFSSEKQFMLAYVYFD